MVCVLAFGGCFRAVLLNSIAIEKSNEDDIVVSIKDGRQVSFDSHQYNLDSDENGQRVLRGKGKSYSPGESQFDSFDGTIPLDDIVRISTSEKTSMFYISIVAATLGVAFALLLTTSLHRRGFGG